MGGSTRREVPMTLIQGWYALQVRPHCEQVVARMLLEKRYEPFLPTGRVRRSHARRDVEREMPLFPTYVFCRVTQECVGRIVTTPGVVRIVSVGRTPARIDEGEIAALRTVVTSGLPAERHPFIQAGDRVRICSGPLVGLEGVLLQRAGRDRFIISVWLLKRSVAIEMSGAQLLSLAAQERA
jgi:transcription antitermination factor NusG